MVSFTLKVISLHVADNVSKYRDVAKPTNTANLHSFSVEVRSGILPFPCYMTPKTFECCELLLCLLQAFYRIFILFLHTSWQTHFFCYNGNSDVKVLGLFSTLSDSVK